MAEISPLRRRMIEDMTVRNMSPATQRSYVSAVSKFSRYTINDKIEAYGTARARLGLAFDNWLGYATGGFAVARDRIQHIQLVPWLVSGVTNPGDTDTFWQWRYGFALGAGVEAPLSKDWSAKLEYLYLRFPSGSAFFPLAAQQYTSDHQAHQVRLGLNYHFGDKPDGGSQGLLGDMENRVMPVADHTLPAVRKNEIGVRAQELEFRLHRLGDQPAYSRT